MLLRLLSSQSKPLVFAQRTSYAPYRPVHGEPLLHSASSRHPSGRDVPEMCVPLPVERFTDIRSSLPFQVAPRQKDLYAPVEWVISIACRWEWGSMGL